jgi:hypothetical protein
MISGLFVAAISEFMDEKIAALESCLLTTDAGRSYGREI